MATSQTEMDETTAAVEQLALMFPTIDKNTIRNKLLNEANGDTPAAIPILSQLQQLTNNGHNPSDGLVSFDGMSQQQPSAQPVQIIVVQQQPIIRTNKQHQELRKELIIQEMKTSDGRIYRTISIIFWIVAVIEFLATTGLGIKWITDCEDECFGLDIVLVLFVIAPSIGEIAISFVIIYGLFE
eukprot:324761_1